MMRIAALLLALLAACDVPPRYVENKDIDYAMLRGKYRTVCRGLDMKEDRVRRYATSKLAEVDDPISRECICSHLPDEREGWDRAVAEGLKATKRDDLAACFAELVKRPDLPHRTEAVVALSLLPTPTARATLAEIAAEQGAEPEVRLQALEAVAHDVEFEDTFLELLAGDPLPEVRAAAAEAISGFTDERAVAALRRAWEGDDAPAVRAAALRGLKKAGVDDADALLCRAMMEDPEPAVRRAAILAYKGTKRKEAIACLRRRALAFEEDPSVRDALLEVLKSSPAQEAADVLCDAIPFWMRSYVKEDIPDKVPGTGIIAAQNDRDWPRSYECLQRAWRNSRGYSCYARMYVAWWFREVGGQVRVPPCPGYENPKDKARLKAK